MMKVFKSRVLAILMAACMMLSLLPVSALATEGDFELTLDVGGTGVTWYAEDKEGTQIGDEGFAVPAAEIEIDTDGEVPTITLSATLYLKADPGYAITDLEQFDLDIDGDDDNDGDLPATLDIEVTDEGLEYCDLMVTLKFAGYAVESNSASLALTIDAEPTYLTITVGDTKLDIQKFSTESYAAAEAIACAVAYDKNGTTVAVSASVEATPDSIIVEEVLEGDPAFDGEPHNGVTTYVDVTPENTIDNPVYVAVKYIPGKEGVEEAKPYDEFFKIALYMTAPDAPPSDTPPSDTPPSDTPPSDTPSFTDVFPGDYYYDAVTWAAEQGVSKGTGDGTTFSPGANCTRAQFVTFLWRAAGSPEATSGEIPFSDVSETKHADYYKAILWAVDLGVANGTGDGTTFSPDAAVTRAQAVTFMHRYAQKAGIATETGAPSFDDVSNEGSMIPYYDAIGWAVANGITNGNSSSRNTFGPMDTCIRGQMITFLYRLFEDVSA